MNESALPGFTHLHVHSQFTLLGGTASVDDLVARAATDGMRSLALTDTNALYGAVAFAAACRRAGIQPVIGMLATMAAPDKRAQGPSDGSPADGMSCVAGQLVLLAMGPAGYRSLCRLSSLIQANPEREARAACGFSWDDLHDNKEGLICLGAGRMGWVERCLRAGDMSAAQMYAGRLAGIFGENAYLGLELHTPADTEIARQVAKLAARLGLPTVAVEPVYCLSPRDAPRLRLLAAVDANCSLDEVPPERLPAAGDPRVGLHWLSPGQVAERFVDFPEALATIPDITARCGPALPDGSPIWPALSLPGGQTPDQALAAEAAKGLATRYGPDVPASSRERLAAELATIGGHGYAPLFLIVADIVRYARAADIPVSTRGSVANSLVAYCIGITTVDPIAHDLLFERFLNPARADAPDIDLDFCSRRRDEVLDYVRRAYGAEHVALVGTVSTMQPRSAVWETGKAYGLTEPQIKRLVALLPHRWHPDPRRRDRRTAEDVLRGIDDPHLREVVSAAYGIVGQPHHLSVHPGGVVIAPGPLTDVVPVQWAPKGFLITQFDHGDVEALGLPKIDLLGISALTVLADTVELIRRNGDPLFRLDDIPEGDPRTGDLLARGETVGVFQCESEGARGTLRKLRARTTRDLAIANAFFKPGPSNGGMAGNFVRRYRGEEAVRFLHPALAPILGPTQGVLIFQEQILRVAREIAGLSWAQADHLRRGASKFGAAEMATMHEQFVAGCCRPGGPGFMAEQAERLWEQVHAFAGYGFNQGHATAYAEVSYRSAYLRAHWPAEFFCARLAGWGGFHHPAIYIAEAVRLGIAVRPPHVNFSGARFTLTRGEQTNGDMKDGATLWMGLGQVRDLRETSIDAILAERERGPYTGLRDLQARVSLHPKEITHLVQCGALDGLGASRKVLLAEAEEIRRVGNALQMMFGFAGWEIEPESQAERLAWEQDLLGWPVSVHPFELVIDRLPPCVSLSRLQEHPGRPLVTAGARLPGWTGSDGFYLGNGDTYVAVKGAKSMKAPAPWQTVIVRGRWAGDGWGSCWLQADKIEAI